MHVKKKHGKSTLEKARRLTAVSTILRDRDWFSSPRDNAAAIERTMEQLSSDPEARRKQLERTTLKTYPIVPFADVLKDDPVRMFENNVSAYIWKSEYVFKLRGS